MFFIIFLVHISMTTCSVKDICTCSLLTAKNLNLSITWNSFWNKSWIVLIHWSVVRTAGVLGGMWAPSATFTCFYSITFINRLLFPRVPVSTRPSWCPGYCAESQIIAPLLLLLKRLSPLICFGGLQFFFSNAISFRRLGTQPNDPKRLLVSFYIFRGSL